MLRWAAIFLVIALIAALLGFTGIAGAAADIAKFMAEEKGKARRNQAINVDNSASMVVDFDGDASTTYYKGKAVHHQMLSKKSPVDK